MATLTAWKFASPYGADDALATLEKLQSEALIQVQDAAVVSWEPGRNKPKTREMHSTKKAGAWRRILGAAVRSDLLHPDPWAGHRRRDRRAVRLAGGRRHQRCLHRQRPAEGDPGTSALFLLSSDTVIDRVATEFKDTDMELISTNLSADQESKLRDAFGHED